MEASAENKMCNELITLLRQGNAFIPVLEVLENVDATLAGKTIPGFPHSIYQLTEHLNIVLHDLIEYSKDSHFKSPVWPDEYWPAEPTPKNENHWYETVQHYRNLTGILEEMITNPETDFWQGFEANGKHFFFRQVGLAITHNAYHTGQILLLFRIFTGENQ